MGQNNRHKPVFKLFSVTTLVTVLAAFCSPSAYSAPISPVQVQSGQEALTIGVLDLDPLGVDPNEAIAISERLRIYLGRQPVFDVIERNKMESIMEEMGFQFSGACDTDECVVQVGKILGASKMVAGSVSKVGNLYSLQIRIVDIATSRIEHTTFKDTDRGIEDVLTTATDEVAQDLAQRVGSQVQPGQQPPQPQAGQPTVMPTGFLTLTTYPVQCQVFIDGQDAGQLTPLQRFTLYEGSYEVELRKEGFDSETRQVTIRPGGTTNLDVTLRASGTAKITLQSTLLGANLLITGDENYSSVLQGAQQPVELRPGHYLIRIKAPGYAPWSREVDLNNGDDFVMPVLLEPRSRVTAGLLSLALPSMGQFYSGKKGSGVLFLIATAGSVAWGAGQLNQYGELRSAYDDLVDRYRAATTYPEMASIKTSMDAKYAEVQSSRDKLSTAVTVIGGIWLLNVIEATALMPRLSGITGGPGAPELQVSSSQGRLTLQLRVNF